MFCSLRNGWSVVCFNGCGNTKHFSMPAYSRLIPLYVSENKAFIGGCLNRPAEASIKDSMTIPLLVLLCAATLERHFDAGALGRKPRQSSHCDDVGSEG